MKTKKARDRNARIDVRLSATQKKYIEQAVRIGGYHSTTAFIRAALQEKAEDIIHKHEQLIVSEEDKATFFEEVTMPSAPNRALIDAHTEFEHLFKK